MSTTCDRVCVCVQVSYSEKDSEVPPSVLTAAGEGSGSLLLRDLRQYAVYVLQVLAYTQNGDGPLSSPTLLRTKEDGRFSLSLSPRVSWCVR